MAKARKDGDKGKQRRVELVGGDTTSSVTIDLVDSTLSSTLVKAPHNIGQYSFPFPFRIPTHAPDPLKNAQDLFRGMIERIQFLEQTLSGLYTPGSKTQKSFLAEIASTHPGMLREVYESLKPPAVSLSDKPSLIETPKCKIKLNKESDARELPLYNIKADGDCLYNSIIIALRLQGYKDLTVAQLRFTIQKKIMELEWSAIVESILVDFSSREADEEYDGEIHGYREPFKTIVDSIFQKFLDNIERDKLEIAKEEKAKEAARQTFLALGDDGKALYAKMVGETNAWARDIEISNLAALLDLNMVIFTQEKNSDIWVESLNTFGPFKPNRPCVPLLSNGSHFDVVSPRAISVAKQLSNPVTKPLHLELGVIPNTDLEATRKSYFSGHTDSSTEAPTADIHSVLEHTALTFPPNLLVTVLSKLDGANRQIGDVVIGDVVSGPRAAIRCLEYYKDYDPIIIEPILKYVLALDPVHLFGHEELLTNICINQKLSSELIIKTLVQLDNTTTSVGQRLSKPENAIKCLAFFSEQNNKEMTTDLLEHILALRIDRLFYCRDFLRQVGMKLYNDDLEKLAVFSKRMANIDSEMSLAMHKNKTPLKGRYNFLEAIIELLDRIEITLDDKSSIIQQAIALQKQEATYSKAEYSRIIGALQDCQKLLPDISKSDEQQALLSDIYNAIYEITIKNRALCGDEYKTLTLNYIKDLKNTIISYRWKTIKGPLKEVYLLLSFLAAQANGTISEAIYYLENTDISEYSHENLSSHYLALGKHYEALGHEIAAFDPLLAKDYFAQGKHYLKEGKQNLKKVALYEKGRDHKKFVSYLELPKDEIESAKVRTKPGLLLCLFKNELGRQLAENNVKLLDNPRITLSEVTCEIPITGLEKYFDAELRNLESFGQCRIQISKTAIKITMDTPKAIELYYKQPIPLRSTTPIIAEKKRGSSSSSTALGVPTSPGADDIRDGHVSAETTSPITMALQDFTQASPSSVTANTDAEAIPSPDISATTPTTLEREKGTSPLAKDHTRKSSFTERLPQNKAHSPTLWTTKLPKRSPSSSSPSTPTSYNYSLAVKHINQILENCIIHSNDGIIEKLEIAKIWGAGIRGGVTATKVTLCLGQILGKDNYIVEDNYGDIVINLQSADQFNKLLTAKNWQECAVVMV